MKTSETFPYENAALSPEERAADLLERMTLEEKIYQVTAEMLFEVGDDYEERRVPLHGSYRNPGHFMHYSGGVKSPSEVARRINRDVELSAAAQPHSIPPIENGEALHGAQWGMATCFPQPIGLASSFDPALVEEVAGVIGEECSAVGVRQVFAPVVNIARDCRWGRTVETYGEDVRLTSDMGAAFCRGLESRGVIATPKHFADNYGAGGRDSNYSDTSERTMREVFLPPFKACFDAGAGSVMAAYNSWEGVPCSCSRRLLTDILRDEWGFKGFVVSDYNGVPGIESAHKAAASYPEAAAKALRAGLDVILPFDSADEVRRALSEGLITEEELDKNVRRILEAKFRLGLFEEPYSDPERADAVVRSGEHRALALKAARESIVLLKNSGVLPFDKTKLRRIGVFGESAEKIPVGENYSGPYKAPWRADGADTPLSSLRACLGEDRVIFATADKMEEVAPLCDVCVFFTSVIEGEGSDRSDIRLPGAGSSANRSGDAGLIVDESEQSVALDQEREILRLCRANPNTVVVLLNGSPVDMTAWHDGAGAIIEAWYPGEQGARALTEILFGEVSPSGKLPITFPKSVGQLPLYYSYKPSGRGYAYCDDDGRPLYPFGYGLSYTEFEMTDAKVVLSEGAAAVEFTVKNVGGRDGAEVAQVYFRSEFCEVVRPVLELKAYKRIALKAGESARARVELPADAFSYYNESMDFAVGDGRHTVLVGASSDSLVEAGAVAAKNGGLSLI